MQRIHLVCLLAILMVVASTGPVSASEGISAAAPLTDLSPVTTDATDGARAWARALEAGDRTVVRLRLDGLGEPGITLGAHVHVGPCVEGDGAAALGHYNSGGDPSPSTEVWLDFVIRPSGRAHALAIVPFHIEPGGARSIVIHALPTAPGGAAGPRLACLPMEF